MAYTKPTPQVAVFKSRIVKLFGIITLCYVLLAGRLVFVQAYRHHYYQAEAEEYRVAKALLPASRGMILDRNNEPLAVNVPACSIFADPVEVTDPAQTAAQLAPILGMDPVKLTQMLTPRTPRSHFYSLKRHEPLDLGDKVKALKLLGIGVGPDSRRAYPNRDLAPQVIGFTDGNGAGLEGVEFSQDKAMIPQDGLIVAEVDRQGHFLPWTMRRRRDPENGADVVLTIDKNLQQAADRDLAADIAAHHAQRGVVIILDPRTGEILALSNEPSYDPNQPRPDKPMTKTDALAWEERWRDTAVSDLYEPGSTLKTITGAAVLQEEGPQMMNVHVFCSGQLKVGGHTIHCAPDPPYYGVHGDEDMRGVLKESCNIGMAQFALHLGSPRLFKYEKLFGFLDYPDSGLPGETKSTLQSPDEYDKYTGSVGWPRIKLANVAFGQGISITPLQLAMAYGAIANDGVLMQPHIVHAIVRHTASGDQRDVVAPQIIRRVLQPNIAKLVQSMLGTVVQEGTGKPAQISDFSVGGKTGSAQVSGPRGYEAGHYVASFVGVVPLSQPRLVILCAVFEPQGVHWGAAVAAPVVHDLAKLAVRQMHLFPDAPGTVDWADHLKKKPLGMMVLNGAPSSGTAVQMPSIDHAAVSQ